MAGGFEVEPPGAPGRALAAAGCRPHPLDGGLTVLQVSGLCPVCDRDDDPHAHFYDPRGAELTPAEAAAIRRAQQTAVCSAGLFQVQPSTWDDAALRDAMAGEYHPDPAAAAAYAAAELDRRWVPARGPHPDRVFYDDPARDVAAVVSASPPCLPYAYDRAADADVVYVHDDGTDCPHGGPDPASLARPAGPADLAAEEPVILPAPRDLPRCRDGLPLRGARVDPDAARRIEAHRAEAGLAYHRGGWAAANPGRCPCGCGTDTTGPFLAGFDAPPVEPDAAPPGVARRPGPLAGLPGDTRLTMAAGPGPEEGAWRMVAAGVWIGPPGEPAGSFAEQTTAADLTATLAKRGGRGG